VENIEIVSLSGRISVMARVFKIHSFQRWMRKTALTDAALCGAVVEMMAGLIDANLGDEPGYPMVLFVRVR
jgi:hypothetical protein